MDGVMTCRVGHTALTIRWTLANVENDFKTKDFAWKEISVLPENGQIDTSAFLSELVTDAVALQKGIDVVINGTTIRFYGTLFHIIADGKQVTTNIGTKHSSNDPCAWCDLTGIELLSADRIGEKRRYSSIVTSRRSRQNMKAQLPLWWGYRQAGLLFSPLRLHSADMLHVEDLGISLDTAKLLDAIMTPRQQLIINKRLKLFSCRVQLGSGKREASDCSDLRIVAAACLYDMDYRVWPGAYKWLYEDETDYSDVNSTHTRVEFTIPEETTSSLTSCANLSFSHLLLMCVLNDEYSLAFATASTPRYADEALNLAIRHRRIFIPLCLKAGVISATKRTDAETYSVRKSKTHFVSHLKEWVKDCGPMDSYSAQVG
ncbi:hypothetical protein ADUPG1_010915, partial [Aduncisulcus paluster]